MRITHLMGLATASMTLVLAGCYVEEDSARAPAPTPVETAEAEPAEPAPARSTRSGGGGSTYGAAKRSAKSTNDKLAERQRELERQLEDPP